MKIYFDTFELDAGFNGTDNSTNGSNTEVINK